VKDSDGITLGLAGYLHTTLYNKAGAVTVATKLVNGVATISYSVMELGTHTLKISTEGVETITSSDAICTPATSKATRWEGYYVQNGQQQNMAFNLVLTSNRTVTGQGTDNVGPFTWTGNYVDNQISLKKQYTGSYAVSYQGTVSKSTDGIVSISGLWSLATAQGSGSGTFSMTEQTNSLTALVGSCSLTVISHPFNIVRGKPKTISVVTHPPTTLDSSDYFSISAQMLDQAGNNVTNNSLAYLTLIGGAASDLTSTNSLVANFSTGMVHFTGLQAQAGRDQRLVVSNPYGVFNTTIPFKSTVVPTTFHHTVLGMTEESWLSSGVQDSYKATVADSMGSSVLSSDVNITSYTVITRRGSSGVNVNHQVALTDPTTATAAVAALEQATQSGNFDNAWQNFAKATGTTLPSNIASQPVSGTSSASMKIPAKYDAEIAAAEKAATLQAERDNAARASSASSSAQKWETISIVFIAGFGLAMIAIASAFFVHRKRPGSPAMENASSIGGDFGPKTPGGSSSTIHTSPAQFDHNNDDHMDDILGAQDAEFQPKWTSKPDPAAGRERSESSTVKIELNELDDAAAVDDVLGQI
jgi:hypothetical protein